MSDESNRDIFKILSSLREQLATVNEKLKHLLTGTEFSDFKLINQDRVNKIERDITKVERDVRELERDVSALNVDKRENDELKKKEEREHKKRWVGILFEIVKALITAMVGAVVAINYGVGG